MRNELMLGEIQARMAELHAHLDAGGEDVQEYEWTRQELMALIYEYQDMLPYQDKVQLVADLERLQDAGLSPSFAYDAYRRID